MIRVISCSIVVLAFTACTTTRELREQPSCSVWRDQGSFGPAHIAVNEGRATARTKCLLYFWWCSSFEAHIDADGKIFAKGSFGSERQIAILNGDDATYVSSFADKFAKSSPVHLDMKTLEATRTVEVTLFKDMKRDQKLEFNSSCSRRDAAVGAISLWILEQTER